MTRYSMTTLEQIMNNDAWQQQTEAMIARKAQ